MPLVEVIEGENEDEADVEKNEDKQEKKPIVKGIL